MIKLVLLVGFLVLATNMIELQSFQNEYKDFVCKSLSSRMTSQNAGQLQSVTFTNYNYKLQYHSLSSDINVKVEMKHGDSLFRISAGLFTDIAYFDYNMKEQYDWDHNLVQKRMKVEVREYDGDYVQNGFSRRGIQVVNLSEKDTELGLEVVNAVLGKVSTQVFTQIVGAVNDYILDLREKVVYKDEEQLRDIFETRIGIDGGVHYHEYVFDPYTDNHAPIFINW